ncbi:hypothetical protein AC1031_013376 [Aphanomyces cochlioides]|nr:hypothetical protein AC1031_013376 [Aphanomyces cochlioides]
MPRERDKICPARKTRLRWCVVCMDDLEIDLCVVSRDEASLSTAKLVETPSYFKAHNAPCDLVSSVEWSARWVGMHQLGNLLVKIAGAFAVFLVIVDVIYNNWELIYYLGNAQYLLTPLLNHPSLMDVAASYAFPKEASLALLSEAGRFMLNDTITAAFDFLTAGGHLIQDASYDICGALAKSYPNVSATAATVNLGVVTNSLFYVRGTTLSNFFGMTATNVAPPKSNDATLTALGYAPARLDTDLKLTTPLAIPPSGTNTTANVTMYRFFPKSFCTGCSPIVELGRDKCAVVYTYNATSRVLKVMSSQAYIGDTHLLGVILERSSASKASLYVRGICVFLAIMGYHASQKTIRWTDATAHTPWYKRLLYIFSPPLYRYSSDTYSLPDFFLNSDVGVFGYTVAMLLDEKQSMVYTRQLAKWVQATGADPALLDPVMMALAQLRRPQVHQMAHQLHEHDAADGEEPIRRDVQLQQRHLRLHRRGLPRRATTDCIDTVRLDLFQSQYIRAFPSLIPVMIVNLMAVLALDHLLHFRHVQLDAHLDGPPPVDFYELEGYNGQPVMIHARTLTTIQWFLTYHTTSFGLAEETRKVRATVATSPCDGDQGVQHEDRSNGDRRRCDRSRARGLLGQSLLNNPMATLPSDMSGQTDVSTKEADDKDVPSNDMLKEMFMLVQDSEHPLVRLEKVRDPSAESGDEDPSQ